MRDAPFVQDDDLLDAVQQQTLRYFWNYAHPSGMALDRSGPGPYGADAVAVGGTGFGIMALVVGVHRGWLTREDLQARLMLILTFLEKADRFHGVFPHFLNGVTGRAIPFEALDDGADLVETAFMMAGLLAARQFLASDTEAPLRARINRLWREVEWNWHTDGKDDRLYWHWSPRHHFKRNFPIRGWNECLITYVLATASPTFPVDPGVYRRCWLDSPDFVNGRDYYGIRLPLGPPFGGSLCFAHYSFLGIDPRGLVDEYADYFDQNVRHTRINLEHCIRNPGGFAGYGRDCWGLTASDDDRGYHQHAPDNDFGIIAPTAALSSMPYTPEDSMRALRTYLGRLRPQLWTPMGLRDAFCESRGWFDPACLAIDQGPIVIMIENHRSGLVWDLGMDCPEILTGLSRLGFSSPRLTGAA